MEINTKEMKTVKEWAKIAGLKLYNYDGFTRIYETLSGNKSDGFVDSQIIRSRDAGDLLCTRRGFESGLSSCTMEIPQISSLEKISDVLPDYVESHINFQMSAIYGYLKHINGGDSGQREEIKKLLELMKLKNIVKEKSIKINGITKKNQINKLKKEEFNQKQYKMIKRFDILKLYKGTVEDLESYLSNIIIQNLEKVLKKRNSRLNDNILDKIKILLGIFYSTARKETDKDIEEEFIYIKFPRKEENFEQSYNIIDGKGMREGKLFKYRFENTTVKGAIPILSNPNDEQIKPNDKKR